MSDVLSTTTRVRRHVVELRHMVTGETVDDVSARLAPPSNGWALNKTTSGSLVVSSLERVGLDDRPDRLIVRLADPRIAERLELGPDCESIVIDPEKCELTIPLDLEHRVLEIPAAPQQVRVTLVDEDGDPILGSTVVIRSSSGAAEPTGELGDGVYETALRSFTRSFAIFKVIVDGNETRTAGLEADRQTTHVHVIDTN